MNKIPLDHDQLVGLVVLLALMVTFGLGIWRHRQNFFHNPDYLILTTIAIGVLYWIFRFVPKLRPAEAIVAGIVVLLFYFSRSSRKC